jgi:hypothetical protein
MITNLVVLAFIVGLLTGAVVVGAASWAKSLGLRMRWWKWLLFALWYFLLLFLLFAAFTFMGEGEVAAGWKTIGISLVILVILGAGLVRILLAGRKHRET